MCLHLNLEWVCLNFNTCEHVTVWLCTQDAECLLHISREFVTVCLCFHAFRKRVCVLTEISVCHDKQLVVTNLYAPLPASPILTRTHMVLISTRL